MEDFIFANFCWYSYETPQKISGFLFNPYLCSGGSRWEFDPQDYFYSEQTDMACYLFRAPASGDIVLAFRGTDSWTDWITNLQNRSYEQWPIDIPESKVGYGWAEGWKSLRGAIIKRLLNLVKANDRIVVTGHSLGGVLAVVAAIDISQSVIAPGLRMKLVTFAAPFAGNQVFSDYLDKLCKQRFEAYNMYWDESDSSISIINSVMALPFPDPFTDYKACIITNLGTGHSIESYANIVNPGWTDYTTGNGEETLLPDDQLNELCLVLNPQVSFIEAMNYLPLDISWVIGLHPDGSGGKSFSLYRNTPGAAPVYGFQCYVFSGEQLAGLTVSSLQRCKFTLTSNCEIYDLTCNIDVNKPIGVDSLQVIVNRMAIHENYAFAMRISLSNPSFFFNIPTPHYDVVGGVVDVSNDTSTKKYYPVMVWGESAGIKKTISDAYCYSDYYYQNSYGYTSFYVAPPGYAARHQLPVIIGGAMMVYDSSNKFLYEEVLWGERSENTVDFTGGYCWVDNYNNTYGYSRLYRTPVGAAPAKQPRIVGGMMQVPDGNSYKTVYTWGEVAPYRVDAYNNYCFVKEIGKTIGYTSFYTDVPVETKGPAVVKLKVSIAGVTCIRTENSWLLDRRDKVFLKVDGKKKWPADKDFISIGDGQSMPANLVLDIDTFTPARVELWQLDTRSDDRPIAEQLLEFFFSNQMLACDSATGTFINLEDAVVGNSYQIFGRKVAGDGYEYYLTASASRVSV